MMLTIAAEHNYAVLILNVQTAFLSADVNEGIYVKMAPSTRPTTRSGNLFTMKLKKSIYGLRKSPKIGLVP